MKPVLVARSGPLAGTIFAIAEGETGLGRAGDNVVRIDDGVVSRNHGVISRTGDTCLLRDLGSHNRTFVNGIPIETKQLEHGDEIRVGGSSFVFSTEFVFASNGNANGQPMLDGDESSDSGSTVVLPSDQMLSRLLTLERSADTLRTLLQAGELVSSERNLDALTERLLKLIAAAVPARAVVILLTRGSDSEDSWRQSVWTKEPRQIRFPRSIVRRVMQEQVAILSSDVLTGDVADISESIVASRIRAVAAAPLVTCGNVIGVVGASTDDPSCLFTREHLELLTGISAMVAGGLQSLVELAALQADKLRLQEYLSAGNDLVGASEAMQAVQRFVWKVAPSPSSVLITGESGTGKELVARAFHRNSSRSGKPFIAINCAALTESLVESELFGHEKGAFTGAIAQKKGKIEEADQGTLFLDEVGELAPALQAKLLRVLQEKEFERVGGTKTIRVDIRLIAATNRDLEEMVERGTFRPDLFYRLNVVSIRMPPLRDRREDIPLLARFFLEKLAPNAGRRITGFAGNAIDCLKKHEWPGNVRELRNVVERAIVLGAGPTINCEDLPESLLETGPSAAPSGEFHELVNDAKRRIITSALDGANGNYSDAARRLGIHPNNLHRLIRTLGVRRSPPR